jgi:hypothetical protein
MYNERREGFAIQDVILQIAFVVLFVFLLLWLFPTRTFIKDMAKPIDQAIFNENVDSMKESAQSYFTLERLPSKVGDKTTLTLGEMLSKKLLLPFANDEEAKCDVNNSYVEVTKLNTEWSMKINLECGASKDYIVIPMGCYDFCEALICEKEEVKPIAKVYEYEYKKVTGGTYSPWSDYSAWSTVRQTTNDLKREDTKTETITFTEEVKTGNYVRDTSVAMKTETFSSRQTSNNSFEYANERIITSTGTGYVTQSFSTRQTNTNLLEYKNERITYERTGTVSTQTFSSRQTSNTTADYVNERITYVRTGAMTTQTFSTKQTSTNTADYTNERISYVRTGSYTTQDFTTKKTSTNTADYVYVSSYTKEEYQGRQTFTIGQTDTATTKYRNLSISKIAACDTCALVTYYSYDVYKVVTYYRYNVYPKVIRYTYDVYAKTPRYTYDVYAKTIRYTYDVYGKVTSYMYDVYRLKEEVKLITSTKTITYYRYQTRTYSGGTVSIKWSRSKTDQNLLSQGYKLTGNRREVKIVK